MVQESTALIFLCAVVQGHVRARCVAAHAMFISRRTYLTRSLRWPHVRLSPLRAVLPYVPSWNQATEEELDMLDLVPSTPHTLALLISSLVSCQAAGLEDNSRLGCQVKMTAALDGMRVVVPDESSNMMD